MGLLKKLFKNLFKRQINNYRGMCGEKQVITELNPWLFGKVEHRLINNLVLTDTNGKTHQIDHIEIRENGIFCIETKNYKGWIFGNANQDKWTQTLYNKEKHSFLNPLKQNKSHVYYLNRLLGNKFAINSLIVMVQNNADRIDCDNVINLSSLRSYLRNFNDGTKLSVSDMDEIYNILMNNNTKITNEKHIANIKKTQEDLKKGICPRCGNKLVLRTGKNDQFYGCSNYPKCKFTMKK